MRLAIVVNYRQVKWDPTMVDFNTHEHFLRIVSQARSMYDRVWNADATTVAMMGSDARAMAASQGCGEPSAGTLAA